jgi:hypothetical protein
VAVPIVAHVFSSPKSNYVRYIVSHGRYILVYLTIYRKTPPGFAGA